MHSVLVRKRSNQFAIGTLDSDVVAVSPGDCFQSMQQIFGNHEVLFLACAFKRRRDVVFQACFSCDSCDLCRPVVSVPELFARTLMPLLVYRQGEGQVRYCPSRIPSPMVTIGAVRE